MTNDIQSILTRLGHTLPVPAASVAGTYEPYVAVGNLLHFSGLVSIGAERGILGRLGDTLTTEQGRRAAELCALGLMSRLNAALEGDLSRLNRLVRLGVYVCSTPDFFEHGKVGDAASELFLAVFGQKGRHTRTSIGVSSLPRGAAVEIDAVIELRT